MKEEERNLVALCAVREFSAGRNAIHCEFANALQRIQKRRFAFDVLNDLLVSEPGICAIIFRPFQLAVKGNEIAKDSARFAGLEVPPQHYPLLL
jgi:hypothetical protein